MDLTSSEWAAWVQAGGAILALFVTILLSRLDARERKWTALLQARNAAIALHPTLRATLRELEWATSKLEAGREPDRLEFDVHGQYWIDVGMLRKLHEKLLPHLPWISSLGVAAPSVQRAFRAIDAMTEDLQSYYHEFLDADDKVFDSDRWPDSRKGVERALTLLRKAMVEVDDLLAH